MQATINQSANPRNDVFKHQRSRLPTAGTIRPGIKVLTKAAREEIPNAEKIYSEAFADGVGFDDIEKLLKKANPKFTKRPLTPNNSPYFRVNQADFNAPGAAQIIIDKYGEDKGTGDGLQVYRFPAIFPPGQINQLFRQQFVSWSASKMNRWSDYDANGQIVCREFAKVEKNSRRRFGGRANITLGPCDPNECEEFNDGKCNHSCSLSFYVPGCPGIGMIELSFNSVYAAMGIQETLELVQNGLGRIHGVLDGKPIFYLTKRLENVSRIDWKTGEAKRANQYIIRMEADIDMTSVFQHQERQLLSLGLSPEEIETLNLPGPVPSEIDDEPAVEIMVEPTKADISYEQQNGRTKRESKPDQEKVIEPRAEPVNEQAEIDRQIKQAISETRKDQFDRADALGLTVDEFGQWGVDKFGASAFKEIETLTQIEEFLVTAEKTGDLSEWKPASEPASADNQGGALF